MITVENISKQFKQVQALQGASFTAQNGKITGLLGPNGAGKTTLLRIIFGLLQADAGRVSVDEKDPGRDPIAVRAKLGILTDQFGLYERLSTREHLEYFGRLHRMDEARLQQRISEISRMLDMGEILERRSAGFSQGQRIKVALARAVLHQPQNVLLDEPTRGLDVMSTRAVRNTLQELRAQGCCVVFSSHVMQEVSALCDDVVVMAKGRVVAQGTPQALCELAGKADLEDAFVSLIGSDEGIAA
ncbi:ATP-binding cassette domain-containing protein [Massilia sp. W12]|uniref:ABC transporter ATP-binding protein n=1 Tax=Massilia sp. W12 TaxID=3126507 RepID=UPI0030D48DA3